MKYLLRVSLLAVAVALLAPASQAQQESFVAILNGASENPANASPGTGFGIVIIDPTAHTMFVQVSFSNLMELTDTQQPSGTTASHIHGPAIPPANAGVMTTTPSFAGFPLGVRSGFFSNTLNTLDPTSYNAAFLNNATNQGNVATAETTMFNIIRSGQAYWNIHTNFRAGGEIRGFLQANAPEPASVGLLGLGLGMGAVALRRRKK